MELPTIDDIKKVLPIKELAARTGFGWRTLYGWLENGDVPGKGLAREYRIKAICDALDKARAEQPARPKRRPGADRARAA